VGHRPTAGANDGKGTAKPGQRRGQLDEAAAQLWSTPRGSPNENRTTHHAPSHGNSHGRTLAGDCHSFHQDPPIKTDGQPSSPAGPNLSLPYEKRTLNPAFVP